MRNDILEGMEKNKENYVGIIFIGEIIKGLNIDDDLHNELVKIDYEFATFSIFPSVSCHDIYDDDCEWMCEEGCSGWDCVWNCPWIESQARNIRS